jgi:hypothetical protein
MTTAAVTAPAAAPVQREWHVWFNGLTLGWPQTEWSLTNLSGWTELPTSTPNNTDRQGRWGAFPGLQTFGSRTVEAEFTFTGYGDPETLRRVRAALTPDEDPQEQELWIWAGTRRPEMVRARVDKAAIPSDQDFSLGYHRVTVAWEATDPIRYGDVLNTAEAKLAVSSDLGLHFKLDFEPGLEFGGALGGGVAPIVNDGLLAVWPTFTIQGPVQAPVIELLHTGPLNGRRIAFSTGLNLPAKTSTPVVIDTNNRYAEQGGTSRAHLMTERDWFQLPAGFSQIKFSAASPSPDAVLTVSWRTGAII